MDTGTFPRPGGTRGHSRGLTCFPQREMLGGVERSAGHGGQEGAEHGRGGTLGLQRLQGPAGRTQSPFPAVPEQEPGRGRSCSGTEGDTSPVGQSCRGGVAGPLQSRLLLLQDDLGQLLLDHRAGHSTCRATRVTGVTTGTGVTGVTTVSPVTTVTRAATVTPVTSRGSELPQRLPEGTTPTPGLQE